MRIVRSPIAVCGISIVMGLAGGLVPDRSKAADLPPETLKLLKTFDGEFIRISPGEKDFPPSFAMGSDKGPETERPAHRVTFGYSFSMARYEVPQNMFEAVTGRNPSRWKGGRNAVEMFSFEDAVDFCNIVTRLLREARLLGDDEEIRLPTEAEWEYCCRAGTTTAYSFGESAIKAGDDGPRARLLDEYGWHTGNAAGNDPPVGAKKPNPWGLYDMHGYLWEFVSDAWHDTYAGAPGDGSSWSSDERSPRRVIRGGSWKDRYEALRSASRRPIAADARDDAVGMRCVKAKVQASTESSNRDDDSKSDKVTFEPTDQYSVREIEGWKVYVNQKFENEKPELCAETLALLKQQLYQIVRMVPKSAVEKLRKIAVWVELDEPHHPCMCYHPHPGWLRDHDMNTDKARSIEIANARNLATTTPSWPPHWVRPRKRNSTMTYCTSTVAGSGITR